MNPIPARLQALRSAMKAAAVDACLIPSADPHLSEYLPDHWQTRQHFSGFTGSVATLIVTGDFAGLWVDSRYWSQAESELAGTGIHMMKTVSAAATTYLDWMSTHLEAGQVLAVDGMVLGLATARMLQAQADKSGFSLRTDLDLADQVWPDRPALPTAAVYRHEAPFAAVSRADKLIRLRQRMAELQADQHLISTVDDIAWLLNLRGADVSYNPVFIAHLLLDQQQARLFISAGKVSAGLAQQLAQDGVQVCDYRSTVAALQALPAEQTLLLDPRRVTFGIRSALPAGMQVCEAINPTVFFKSRKTAEEADFVRAAMEQDGAALCEFFAWFEAHIGRQRITELDIDEQVCAARARQPNFVSPSFGTIAGFNGNGAMPHYRATQASHAVIEGNGLLLIDSGGQYLNGTTDITRVVAVGSVSAEQKRDFTLVLKGMINLSRAHFPLGTLSPMLDVLARVPLWQQGINFGHGTGHGVGYFLNVHEGPQSISGAMPEPHMAMQPGMITSNEPGIYRPGQWGVRIENLLLNVEAADNQFGHFLAFETLTLCPIDYRCIDTSLMNQDEINWLNDYHAEVRRRLAPRVSGAALAWLENFTRPVAA